MPVLSRFNDAGQAEFELFLDRLREDPYTVPPIDILTDPQFSEVLTHTVEIDARSFGDSFELAKYLHNALAPLDPRTYSRDVGMWSWLALLFIDHISPQDDSGKRASRQRAVYVLSRNFSFRSYYRHAVRSAWQSYHVHGDVSRVLLITATVGALRSDVAEQIGAYADLFGNRAIVKLADRLWLDHTNGLLRRGSGGKGLGSPRRFVAVLKQLQLTFDLADCATDTLLGLLPPEFDRWK
jgi:hypothetical protein